MLTDVRLTEKQAEYVRNADARWNFAVGAVRSGKSHLAVLHLIPNGILERRGERGLNLILGATLANVERNVLGPMRDIYGSRLVGGIRNDGTAELFGERVWCLGAESRRQISKLRGSEVKYCYCDEVCDVDPQMFELLKSRLSLGCSRFDGACNPEGPQHFVKRFIDTPGLDVYAQTYELWDNPFLPASYVSALEAEYAGTVWYDRYVLGLWTLAEGLVWPQFREALEASGPDPATATRRFVSCDYGTQNAFAALGWELSRGTWHVTREYRYSGRDEGHQKTDADYVADMRAFLGEWPASTPFVVDPSAASFIAAMRRDGLTVRKARNDVMDGIRETASAMATGALRIVEDATPQLQRELAGYVWDEREGADRPVKVEDHSCDALRYGVATMGATARAGTYTSPFSGR